MTEDSSPCFAHTLVNGQPVDPEAARDVARFRKSQREHLLTLRRETSVDDLANMAQKVSDGLNSLITPKPGLTIAAYWPIRGELDLRPWMGLAHEAGATVAVPVVVEKNAPVEFHIWSPGCKMERGFWNIPVPVNAPVVTPDVVLSPLLGVDEDGFRLGNGGGYYDRTLAACEPLPHVIGVGHDFCRMKTIFPMPWDIGMHDVVLGDGSVTHHRPRPSS